MSARTRRSALASLAAATAILVLALATDASAAGPYTMTISTAATSNMTLSGGLYAPTTDGANLNVSDLVTALATQNITVGGSAASSITVASSITSSGGSTLTLTTNSGSGVLVSGSPTLQIPTLIFNAQVAGTGDLTVTGNSLFSDGLTGLSTVNITGNATLDGTSNIGSVAVSGTASLAGNLTTTTSQTYGQAVTLTGDTVLNAGAGSGAITFDSTVDGSYALSLAGTTTFAGTVGGVTQLLSLTSSGAGTSVIGGQVSTVNTQSYSGAVQLNTSSVVMSGSTVTFDSTLDGSAALTVTGNAVFDGTVGGAQALSSLAVSGSSTLAGVAVSTSGTQAYLGTVDLSTGSSTLSANGVTLQSAVSGPGGLTISGSGTTTFGGNVTPSGSQTYLRPVALGANVTVGVGAGGTATFAGQVSGATHSLTIAGPGVVDLQSVSNSYSGGTTVTGGTLEFSSGGLDAGNLTLNGGSLEWAVGNTEDISPKLQSIGSSGATLDTNGNDVTLADPLTGTGTLTKTGAGTLTLAATSGDAHAPIDVAGGAVTIDGSTVATSVSVQSGATLSCSDSGTLSGMVTNSGGTLEGTPAAPTVTGAMDQNGPTASVSFTAGTANCLPVSYRAQTTSGGFTSAAGALSPLTVGGLAAGTTYAFTVTATNPIGSTVSSNTASAATPSAPSISISSPTDGASYAYNQSVDASYTCADSTGPGISSCQGSRASGAALDTATAGLHTFTVTAISSDGYTATRTVSYTVAAPLSPVIAITAPADGATLTRFRVVDASYSCADATGGTGIASCSGPVGSGTPLDTATLGIHSFTVTATSKDGATATQTVRYTVIRPSNAFKLVKLRARRNGAVYLALSGLGAPGLVVVRLRVRGVPVHSLRRSVGQGHSLAFTLVASRQLTRHLVRTGTRLPAYVSITYTPKGGLSRTQHRRVTLP